MPRELDNRWIWTILIVAMLARFLLLQGAHPHGQRVSTPDSLGYVQLARSLNDSQGFSRPADETGGSGLAGPRPAEVFRTPGYPLLLAGGERIGLTSWGVLGAQVVLDVLLVLLVYLLAFLLAGKTPALLAAGFQALSPLAASSSVRLLSDSLYALLLVGALLGVVAYLRLGGWRWLVAGALVLAAACYVRPVGMVAGVLVVVMLLFTGSGRVRRAAIFAGVLVACLSPWVFRNHVAADYRGLSSFAGTSLYYHGAAPALARAEGISFEQAQDRLRGRVVREFAQADPDETTMGQIARFHQAEAVRIIREHPGAYAGVHLRGMLGFWLPGATEVLEVLGVATGQRGTLSVLRQQGLIAAVRHYFGDNVQAMLLAVPLGLIWLARMAGLAVAVVAGVRRLRQVPIEVWLMVAIVLVSAVAGGPASTPRFRVPVEGLLSIAAGVAFAGFIRQRRGTKAAATDAGRPSAGGD